MLKIGRRIPGARSLVSTLTGLLLIACGNSSSSDGGNSSSSDGGTSSSSNGGNRNDAGGAGPSLTGSGVFVPIPGAAGAGSTASSTAKPATSDENCGTTTTKLTKKPADLLLVLDRSSSMTRAMDSGVDCAAGSANCSQRWETMVTSLTTVIETSSADVYWGLKFFTTPAKFGTTSQKCFVSEGAEVPVATSNAVNIQTQINQAGTANSTPTRLAIQAAVTYLDTVTDTNPKYILLATDGEPNCAPGTTQTTNSDLAGAVTAVGNAAAAGYKVFVIGVGPEASNLTDLAVAGETEHFYSATTPAELSAALSTIVGTVAAGCTYPVDASKIENPNAIGVYIDKSLVPQSATDGFSIDSSNTTITINGTYCTDLTSGKKTTVEIFLPCDTSDPLPPVIQ